MPSIMRRSFAILAIALAAAVSIPAQAQFSDGYKFLEAVRKKEGDKVTEALNEPGTQIINTKNFSTGETALHIVVARRDLTWMQFLISNGANVNVRDNRGMTPLVAACELGFIEGVDQLIKSGARVEDANNTGETPLISAVHRRDLALVRMLIKAGANPDRPDNSGRSARDYATLEGKSSAVLGEIERAAKDAKGTGVKKTYGPSF
ncbi:ankyrin repeat protein [Novosphingobium hassiacum]|uniref:Ankyrin repeat protein n=1 Tax=Novosphingobium hassiacum TaxID=173676 RepID=A0A7W6EX42_9SPHN|nr:ankyrin repeat domain-containing protein [Novosphingobium hassiacum]MBB3861665.1 ankyrin repeat protein [Novosphingobium hassiacum]